MPRNVSVQSVFGWERTNATFHWDAPAVLGNNAVDDITYLIRLCWFMCEDHNVINKRSVMLGGLLAAYNYTYNLRAVTTSGVQGEPYVGQFQMPKTGSE